MNIASIDIGTNTILLLIAKIDENNQLIPLLNVYKMPRIGYQLNKNKFIRDDKIDLMIDILTEYKEICNNYNCTKIIPFATQGMRLAENSKLIVNKVFKKTGLHIEIISGETEAYLSFVGAIGDKNSKSSIIVDIGGGSTEVVYGENNNILYKNSFNFGVVTLTERFLKSIPYSFDEYENLKSFLHQNIEFPFDIKDCTEIISVSGTPTTLFCMSTKLKEYSDEAVDSKILELNEINELIEYLLLTTPEKALIEYGQVLTGRADIILAGATILSIILKKLNKDKTIVSSKGLRYGILYNYLRLNKRENDK